MFGYDSSSIQTPSTVWGCNVQDYNDKRLLNRLDYDDIFGTIINRFSYQALNKKPLTIYGSGNQESGFIHIEDSTSSICNIIESDFQLAGEVEIIPLVGKYLQFGLLPI